MFPWEEIVQRAPLKEVPAWRRGPVDAIRATRPREWAPGTTPWPRAPQGAHAAKR